MINPNSESTKLFLFFRSTVGKQSVNTGTNINQNKNSVTGFHPTKSEKRTNIIARLIGTANIPLNRFFSFFMYLINYSAFILSKRFVTLLGKPEFRTYEGI